ncbi:hypothetical protein HOLleu_30372 [Holothuria leucospilota]|uniref:Uncharacterized protein n=1 Tax=Holothuria leucospilota TaxID=206669 RepID=A0A9Q1H130_HOLLE|nr:hypothetical protein HOLleu_30372 [Holothuria leucospilota]
MKRLLPVSPLSYFPKSSYMHSPDHFHIQILLDMSKHANGRGVNTGIVPPVKTKIGLWAQKSRSQIQFSMLL